MKIRVYRAQKVDPEAHERDFVFENEKGERVTIYLTGSGKIYSKEDELKEFIKDADMVEGETYYFRNVIKQCGFNWNPVKKAWTKQSANDIKKEKREREIKQLLEDIANVADLYVDITELIEDWGKDLNRLGLDPQEVWQKVKESNPTL